MARRHYNQCVVTKTKVLQPEHLTQSGICAACIKCGICEIGKRATTGQPLFPEPFGEAQFGAEKTLPNLHDIQIIPEVFGDAVEFSSVNTTCTLGGFKASLPVVVSALGSTSVAHKNTEALSVGAAQAGIIRVIGENVLATYGKETLQRCITSYLDNYKRHGAILVQGNVEERSKGLFETAIDLGCHGIELKLGQGAKPGLGGEIQFESAEDAARYKQLGYKIIETTINGKRVFQRHCSPGSINKKELKDELFRYSNFEVPIWIKIFAGRGLVEFLHWLAELKADGIPIKAVTIDGHGAGTGMAPWEIMNEVGFPAANVLHKIEHRLPFDIIISGGIVSSSDVAKVLMLGADGTGIGRAFLIAAQSAGSDGVVRFVRSLQAELQMLCACLRKRKLEQIKGLKSNLVALSQPAAAAFGLPMDYK